jgi:hypothetical protein
MLSSNRHTAAFSSFSFHRHFFYILVLHLQVVLRMDIPFAAEDEFVGTYKIMPRHQVYIV